MLTGSEHIIGLNKEARFRLDNIIKLNAQVICGNYRGADCQMLAYLKHKKYPNVTVYETGSKKDFGYEIKDVGKYPAQDNEMRSIADYCLALYDGKSKGTKKNIDSFGTKCRVVNY